MTGRLSVTIASSVVQMMLPGDWCEISRSRKAQWHICALAPEPLKDVDGWIAGYRKFWSETFDSMEDYLEELEHGDE